MLIIDNSDGTKVCHLKFYKGGHLSLNRNLDVIKGICKREDAIIMIVSVKRYTKLY